MSCDTQRNGSLACPDKQKKIHSTVLLLQYNTLLL
jgi:hypothetical protein